MEKTDKFAEQRKVVKDLINKAVDDLKRQAELLKQLEAAKEMSQDIEDIHKQEEPK